MYLVCVRDLQYGTVFSWLYNVKAYNNFRRIADRNPHTHIFFYQFASLQFLLLDDNLSQVLKSFFFVLVLLQSFCYKANSSTILVAVNLLAFCVNILKQSVENRVEEKLRIDFPACV